MKYLLLIPVLFPAASALFLSIKPLKNPTARRLFTLAALALELGAAVLCAVAATDSLKLVSIASDLDIVLTLDSLGRFFSLLVAFMWLMSGLFSQEYMAHEENTGRYYAFLLLSEGALMLLCFAGNYLTLYLGFELMTLMSAPSLGRVLPCSVSSPSTPTATSPRLRPAGSLTRPGVQDTRFFCRSPSCSPSWASEPRRGCSRSTPGFRRRTRKRPRGRPPCSPALSPRRGYSA